MRRVDRQEVEVIPLGRTQAAAAPSLASAGKPLGLSLADRCCLALAVTRRQPVLTADAAWRSLTADIDIVLIR
jgi:PIN domain nuclease of toxin-antitoxin system